MGYFYTNSSSNKTTEQKFWWFTWTAAGILICINASSASPISTVCVHFASALKLYITRAWCIPKHEKSDPKFWHESSFWNINWCFSDGLVIEGDKGFSLPVYREYMNVELHLVAILLEAATYSQEEDRKIEAEEKAKGRTNSFTVNL